MAKTMAGGLEVMHDWTAGDGRAAIDGLLDVFARQHPEESLSERTADNVRLSAKTDLLREDPPDVWFDWPGMNLQPYLDAGVLGDVTHVWEDNDLEAQYLEGARTVSRFDGRYVAVPVNIHRLNNLFYNVDVLETAGIDPSSISSARALLNALEEVRDTTDAIPLVQPWKNPDPLLQLWTTTLLSEHGVDTYDAIVDGQATENRRAIEDTLGIVAELADFVSEDALFQDLASAPRQFADTEAAFFVQGDWSFSVFDEAEAFEYGRDWEHVPFPGTDGVYQMNMDAAIAAEMSDHDSAIDAFLQTAASVDGQIAFNAPKGSIPPRTDVPTEEFSPFQRKQMDQFEASRSQPASLAHGLAVRPDQHIELLTIFASFVSTWDVDRAASEVVAVLSA